MSLVAYDSSDEGSENEENETEKETIVANERNDDTIETIIVQTNSKLSLPSPKVITLSKKDEEEEGSNAKTFETFENFFDMLPKPESLNSTENLEEDNNDVLLKKKTETRAVKPVKKQTVKISVPSLSEFKDLEEEEDEKKPAKIIQPSQKGCGLFSLLVPPNKEMANSKILIPQSVKNTKANIQQLKTIRKSNSSKINDSKVTQPLLDKPYNEMSSDEEDVPEDFFGLTTNKDTPDSSASKLSNTESLSYDFTHKSHEETSLRKRIEDHTIQDSSTVTSDMFNDQLGNSSKTLISNVINLPKEEILQKNKAEVGPKLPVPEQEYNVDMEGNVAFDEKAIEYLCGKRGIKRKDTEIDEANIIEINGEDIKPDEREWLVKALTEEPVQRPISMQSCGINSQSKKKHQITYLAHQAKAMELELKNQWSQNKMTRKQTKSKYGF
ncbi:proline-rich protein PRCC [Linepithema humile]|uniref:proline-rich protein PRCC n=1 Tax=Linepithema humile TaxID=83485 RepID=UPI00351DDE56